MYNRVIIYRKIKLVHTKENEIDVSKNITIIVVKGWILKWKMKKVYIV